MTTRTRGYGPGGGKVRLIEIMSYPIMIELAVQANIHGETLIEFATDGQGSRLAPRNASSARQRIHPVQLSIT